MKRTLAFALLIPLVASLGAAALGLHEPITILGNSEFTEANGVVAGTGTAEDPYEIAGWEIEVPAGERYGVKIENTTAHIVLRGLVVRGANEQKGAAIRVAFASDVTIDSCAVSNSFNGVELVSSSDVTMRSTVIYVIAQGLAVTGESAADYRHDIDTTNQYNNSVIQYIYGADGVTISDLETAHLTIAGSRNVSVTGNNVSDGDGIQLAFVEDSTVEGNIVYRSSWDGIRLFQCSRVTLRDNEMGNNRRAGMSLLLANDNVIQANRFLANDYGLIVSASDGNVVEDNLAAANPTGIEIGGGSTGTLVARNILYHENTKFGVAVDRATFNTVRDNVFAACETGVLLNPQADYNTVTGNTLVASAYGFQIVGSRNEISANLISQSVDGVLFQATFGAPVINGNAFHDNVFYGSTHRHVTINADSVGNRFYRNAFLDIAITNAWVYDLGDNEWTVDGAGNYWGDYSGDDADGDGIGDEPVVVVPAGSVDQAPQVSAEWAAASLGVLGSCERTEVTIALADETELVQPVLIADEPHERFTGYRGMPEALWDGAPAILFVYDQDVEGGPTGSAFTMRTVGFDLDIAFFDAGGSYVGGAQMEAESDTRYTINGSFRYAIELPGGALEEHGIDEDARLILPIGD